MKADLTDVEARDQAERLAGFFKILYDQAVIEHRRKLRLNTFRLKSMKIIRLLSEFSFG